VIQLSRITITIGKKQALAGINAILTIERILIYLRPVQDMAGLPVGPTT